MRHRPNYHGVIDFALNAAFKLPEVDFELNLAAATPSLTEESFPAAIVDDIGPTALLQAGRVCH